MAPLAWLGWGETPEAQRRLVRLAALVTVYIVLGMLYESYVHPLTILSTLPSAGVGALLKRIGEPDDIAGLAVLLAMCAGAGVGACVGLLAAAALVAMRRDPGLS